MGPRSRRREADVAVAMREASRTMERCILTVFSWVSGWCFDGKLIANIGTLT